MNWIGKFVLVAGAGTLLVLGVSRLVEYVRRLRGRAAASRLNERRAEHELEVERERQRRDEDTHVEAARHLDELAERRASKRNGVN